MYNYEIWTIAVPQSESIIREKFFNFMADEQFGSLMVGAVCLELEKDEDIKQVLENYVTTACKVGGFSVNS